MTITSMTGIVFLKIIPKKKRSFNTHNDFSEVEMILKYSNLIFPKCCTCRLMVNEMPSLRR